MSLRNAFVSPVTVCNLVINAVSSLLLLHATNHASTGRSSRHQHRLSLFCPLWAPFLQSRNLTASIWTFWFRRRHMGSSLRFGHWLWAHRLTLRYRSVEGYAFGRERMSPRVVILVVHVFVTFSHTTGCKVQHLNELNLIYFSITFQNIVCQFLYKFSHVFLM